MSHNENNVEKSAARHRPAIWGIAFALLAAVIAGLVFVPWRSAEGTQDEVVSPATTGAAGYSAPAPSETPATDPAAPAGTAPAATGG